MNELHRRVSAVNAAVNEIEDLDIKALVITQDGWIAVSNKDSLDVAIQLLERAGESSWKVHNSNAEELFGMDPNHE